MVLMICYTLSARLMAPNGWITIAQCKKIRVALTGERGVRYPIDRTPAHPSPHFIRPRARNRNSHLQRHLTVCLALWIDTQRRHTTTAERIVYQKIQRI